MKAAMIITGSGPVVVLTSYDSLTDEDLLQKLHAKGVDKFIAYEIPLELARERYGAHYFVVEDQLDLHEDLRILDYNGERAFRTFRFKELGEPLFHEGPGMT